MTDPRRNGPMDPEDALVALDRALDELAAGREVPAAGAAGEASPLATLAAELQVAVPSVEPEAVRERRAAFLAKAAELEPAGGRGRGGGGRVRVLRRSLPVRVVALAAALVLVMAVPAAVARQARPGTPLWPVRQAGQQLRERLADDPVHRAHLRLNTAVAYLAAGAGGGEERRKEMADRAEERIDAALDTLDDLPGAEAAAERARAERLLLEVEALERQDDPDDRSGPGSGSERDDDRSGSGGGDRSGSGGGDDPAGDDRSGRGGGSGGGSGGSGSSGSGHSGGDDG